MPRSSKLLKFTKAPAGRLTLPRVPSRLTREEALDLFRQADEALASFGWAVHARVPNNNTDNLTLAQHRERDRARAAADAQVDKAAATVTAYKNKVRASYRGTKSNPAGGRMARAPHVSAADNDEIGRLLAHARPVTPDGYHGEVKTIIAVLVGNGADTLASNFVAALKRRRLGYPDFYVDDRVPLKRVDTAWTPAVGKREFNQALKSLQAKFAEVPASLPVGPRKGTKKNPTGYSLQETWDILKRYARQNYTAGMVSFYDEFLAKGGDPHAAHLVMSGNTEVLRLKRAPRAGRAHLPETTAHVELENPAWIQREGKLGGPGFLDKAERTQHSLLHRSVKQFGYRSTLASLQVLLRNGVVAARHGAEIRKLARWLKAQYGGAGSFGPSKKANPERLYHVVVRNDATGRDTYMTATPVPHQQAVTIKSKLMPIPRGRRARHMLVEATSATSRYAKAGEGPAPKAKTNPSGLEGYAKAENAVRELANTFRAASLSAFDGPAVLEANIVRAEQALKRARAAVKSVTTGKSKLTAEITSYAQGLRRLRETLKSEQALSNPRPLHDYSQVEHAIVQANKLARSYNQALDRAFRTYGDHGTLVSGVIREHFPAGVKDHLLRTVREFQEAQDRVAAAWHTMHPRTDFYRSAKAKPFRDRMISAGGYGVGRMAARRNPRKRAR